MVQLKGIDVSHWQSGLKLANTDAQFVIVKATQGTTMVDSQCDNFVQQARKLGKPYGVYHFAERGGTAEADYFVNNIQDYLGEAILALDWEANALNYGVSAAKAFLDRVHDKTGIKPVIYTSGSVITSQNWSSVANADYGLWLARWGSSPGSTGAWTTWVLWQYTDAHPTGGMKVDGDYFNGDKSTWKAYATGGKTSGGSSTDTTTGGDDMALTPISKDNTTDQKLPKGEWKSVKVDDHYFIAKGPIDIISGTLNIAVSGMKAGDYALVRLYALDLAYDPDKNERRHTGDETRLIPGPNGGTARLTIPIVWDLGGPAKGFDERQLRVEVKASGEGAYVSEIHIDARGQK